MDKLRIPVFCLMFFVCVVSDSAAYLPIFAQENHESLEHDFGRVSSGENLEHIFEFKEEIKSVISLCECVKAYAKVKDPTLKNSPYIIKIEFDSSGYQGQVEKEVFVLDKQERLVKLKIKAFVQ